MDIKYLKTIFKEVYIIEPKKCQERIRNWFIKGLKEQIRVKSNLTNYLNEINTLNEFNLKGGNIWDSKIEKEDFQTGKFLPL